MKAKIAVATVSGKAYYLLVYELKRRKIPFLSLKPWESIPFNVKVVLTTEKERPLVKHPSILIFDESDYTIIIDEALHYVQGKEKYDKIILGIDPGETFGIAVFGDGSFLESLYCMDLYETAQIVQRKFKKFKASMKIIRLGDGVPIHSKKLLHLLDKQLQEDVIIEIVSEVGTSHFVNDTAHRRGLRDMMSARIIAARQGYIYQRKKTSEAKKLEK